MAVPVQPTNGSWCKHTTYLTNQTV